MFLIIWVKISTRLHQLECENVWLIYFRGRMAFGKSEYVSRMRGDANSDQ